MGFVVFPAIFTSKSRRSSIRLYTEKPNGNKVWLKIRFVTVVVSLNAVLNVTITISVWEQYHRDSQLWEEETSPTGNHVQADLVFRTSFLLHRSMRKSQSKSWRQHTDSWWDILARTRIQGKQQASIIPEQCWKARSYPLWSNARSNICCPAEKYAWVDKHIVWHFGPR